MSNYINIYACCNVPEKYKVTLLTLVTSKQYNAVIFLEI